MKNKDILNIIGLANDYKCRPSTLLDITDKYTAYCLDEACTYIKTMMKNGEEPNFKTEYKSFRDIYKDALK